MKLFNYGGKLENYKQTQKLFIREAKSCLYESTWKDILTYQVVTFWTKLQKMTKVLIGSMYWKFSLYWLNQHWILMHNASEIRKNKILYLDTLLTFPHHHWKKTYGSLFRNNNCTLGSFSLSWPIVVILNYFVNIHWISLKQWNLETSVSCYPEMQWKLFHPAPEIPTSILLTVCYFVHQAFSSDNFFAV